MPYFILKSAPITAVQQKNDSPVDAPGVENGAGEFPKKFFRATAEAAPVEIYDGDYVVIDADAKRQLIRKDAFEFLFKAVD
jgi:hypothetical protein